MGAGNYQNMFQNQFRKAIPQIWASGAPIPETSKIWNQTEAETRQGNFKDTLAEQGLKKNEQGCQETQRRVPMLQQNPQTS